MIYLMRHGQDDEVYVGGWSKVSLIPEGIEEVKESGIWIRDNLHIEEIICSDVLRAQESAQIVGDILGISYKNDYNLREQNKGDLNGLKKSIAYTSYPGFMDGEVGIDTVFPNGESLRQLYVRIGKHLETILTMKDNTLLVTHRGVINMIYFLLNGQDLDMDKKQFGVETASVHELDQQRRLIKRIR